ncbi:DMT family transporter [Marinomonas arenicola]|uniref:DMT family transporter n=1 Tax=Marinomonas arenicola TaxID=569601 RepID=UPI00311E450B
MTMNLKLTFSTFLALVAFAANSILCRLALVQNDTGALIDPTSFTLVRLISGALMLLILCLLYRDSRDTAEVPSRLKQVWQSGNWSSATALFIYALGFSYAYVSLATGVGALILFGAVQITLILLSFINGHRMKWLEWLGLAVAFSGFVYLVLPTLSTPSAVGFVLMALAGVAWGIYTWHGKKVSKALFATTSNFIRTLPLLLIALAFVGFQLDITLQGFWLAVASGALMSGMGYAIWYAVLAHMSASVAAVLQLLVPILATLGGVIFANEAVTLHLILASAAVLGGVLIVLIGKRK